MRSWAAGFCFDTVYPWIGDRQLYGVLLFGAQCAGGCVFFAADRSGGISFGTCTGVIMPGIFADVKPDFVFFPAGRGIAEP